MPTRFKNILDKALPVVTANMEVFAPLAQAVIAGQATQAELAATIVPVLDSLSAFGMSPVGIVAELLTDAVVWPIASRMIAGFIIAHTRKHPPAAEPVPGVARPRPATTAEVQVDDGPFHDTQPPVDSQ